MKKKYKFFNIESDSWVYIRKIYLANTTLTMLEKTMCLATILLVQYRYHSNWSDGKHNAKVRAVN